MSRYPNLSLLLGGYLHQDWDVEHADPEETVRKFAESEPMQTVSAAIKEVEDVLSADVSHDLVLLNVLKEAGSYYDAGPDAQSARSWLTDVHRILKEASHRRSE